MSIVTIGLRYRGPALRDRYEGMRGIGIERRGGRVLRADLFSLQRRRYCPGGSITKVAFMKPDRRAHKGKLVVVIDDDHLVLEATAGLLRAWGCVVVTA